MDYSRFDLPGLWFSIYKQVLAENNKLKKDQLEKYALREVVTSIFIASTQKGVVRPRPLTKFQADMLTLTAPVTDRNKQEKIYNTVKELMNNRKQIGGDKNLLAQNR